MPNTLQKLYTPRETPLLMLAGVFVLANQLGLVLIQDRAWSDLWIVAAWLAAATVGTMGLNRVAPQRDPYLFPATMLLTGWGLNLIHRLLPSFADRQALWMLLGLLALLTVCALPGHLRWLRRYRYTWLVGGMATLLLTILFGVNPSGVGARLWLGFGELFVQPAEPLKILLVVFLASYMADHQEIYRKATFKMWGDLPSWRFLAPIFVMWGLCLVLLIWQRDLGTASIFFLVFLLMLYLASGQALLLLGGFGLLVVAGIGAYFGYPLVRLRIDIWLNPWEDPDGSSFQIVQSLLAVADGGIFGSGIGGGIPTFIPVVHTDFAFAAIAEEWGLIGVIGVVGAMLTLVMRGFTIAAKLREKPFHAYLAAGATIIIAVQSLMIMGGTLNLIPLTGVTLPFVSYGGSSLVTNLTIIGLLIALSREAEG